MTASKHRVELSEFQRSRLNEIANRGRSPARMAKRALALLKADEGQIDDRIADALSISRRTVTRIRKRFCEEGLESALTERPRPGQKRKLDERAEAHLVAIACTDPPQGHTHWTLKLLADKMVELDLVDSIARETVRQTLKKRTQAVEEEGVVHPGGEWRVCCSYGGPVGPVRGGVRS